MSWTCSHGPSPRSFWAQGLVDLATWDFDVAPRGRTHQLRAELAMTWKTRGGEVALGGKATSDQSRRRLGDELAGEGWHGSGRRGHHRVGEGSGISGLTSNVRRREGFAGGEVLSGGAIGLDGGDRLRWRSGEAEASTGCAKSWRIRWWRRRGLGGGDGGAIGGGVRLGRSSSPAISGQKRRGGEMWVMAAS